VENKATEIICANYIFSVKKKGELPRVARQNSAVVVGARRRGGEIQILGRVPPPPGLFDATKGRQ
jgi:hypothetical protein